MSSYMVIAEDGCNELCKARPESKGPASFRHGAFVVSQAPAGTSVAQRSRTPPAVAGAEFTPQYA